MFDDDSLYMLLMMPPQIQQVAITLADDLAEDKRSGTGPSNEKIQHYTLVIRELLDSHRKRGGFGAEPVPLS